MWTALAIFGVAAFATCAPYSWAQPADGATNSTRGYVVAIGGALKPKNEEIWQRLVSLAGGRGASYVVFAIASESPEKSGEDIVDSLKARGATAEFLPVSPLLVGRDVRKDVRDEKLIAKVKAARGVFFSGGAQERIVDALTDKDGNDTPLLAAIREVHAKGGVIAGSSAGAAVMSAQMFRDPPSTLTVMRNGASGLKMGADFDRGLGFVGRDVFVDQHFIKRGRIGRLLPAMQRANATLGVGVEEDSAAIFHGDSVEVLGGGGANTGVLIVDTSRATYQANTVPANVRDATLHFLTRGDRFDLKQRAPLTKPTGKGRTTTLDPQAADFKPYYRSTPYYADMLGDATIVNAMATLIDSSAAEARGLSFSPQPPNGESRNIGFEFRLFKRKLSIGHSHSETFGRETSVFHIGLDVVPVLMAAPLFTPLSTPPFEPNATPNPRPPSSPPASNPHPRPQ